METGQLSSASHVNNVSNDKKKCKREKVEIVSSPARVSNSPSMSPVKQEPPVHYKNIPSFTPIKVEETDFCDSPSIHMNLSIQPDSAKHPGNNINGSRSPSPILGRSPTPQSISLSPRTITATSPVLHDPVVAPDPGSPGGK